MMHGLLLGALVCMTAAVGTKKTDTPAEAPSTGCRFVPGTEFLVHGIDVTTFDPQFLGSSMPDVKQKLLQFSCDSKKSWTSPFGEKKTYDVPDQFSGDPLNQLSISDSSSSSFIRTAAESSKTASIGGGFSFGPLVPTGIIKSASMSTNAAKHVQELLKQEKNVAFRDRVITSSVVVLDSPAQLTLHDGFSAAMKKLPSSYKTTVDKDRYQEFINEFGTHYYTMAKRGGLYHFEVSIERTWEDRGEESEAHVEGNIKSLFSASVNGGVKQSKTSESFAKKTSSKAYRSGGTDIGAEVKEWQNTIPDAPVILSGKLAVISSLFRGDHAREQKANFIKAMDSHFTRASIAQNAQKVTTMHEILGVYSHEYARNPQIQLENDCVCKFCEKTDDSADIFSAESMKSHECKDEKTNLDKWVEKRCGGYGPDSKCVGVIHQDVRLFGKTRSVIMSKKDFSKIKVHRVKGVGVAQFASLEAVKKRTNMLLSYINGQDQDLDHTEIIDGVAEASQFLAANGEGDKEVSFEVGFLKGGTGVETDSKRRCQCFKVKQNRNMWDDRLDAIQGTEAASFEMPKIEIKSVSLKSALELEELRDDMAISYARKYPFLTRFWLWTGFSSAYGVDWEPVCDSGPHWPPQTYAIGNLRSVPPSDAYEQGWSSGSGLLGNGLSHFQSLPFGVFTPCPALQPVFMSVTGAGCKVPPPDWPLSGLSHPCHSSGTLIDGNANNEGLDHWHKVLEEAEDRKLKSWIGSMPGDDVNVKLYNTTGVIRAGRDSKQMIGIAPLSHVYDARLVSLLFRLADEGVQVSVVTLFGMPLEIFRRMGLNPSHSRAQHLGVTLQLSFPANFSVDVTQGDESASNDVKFNYLTMEMMGEGLTWTLGAAEPQMHYNYEKKYHVNFTQLSLRPLARYLSIGRDLVYKAVTYDCQTFAMDVLQVCLEHGQGPDPHNVLSIEDSVEELYSGPLKAHFIITILIFTICMGLLYKLLLWLSRRFGNKSVVLFLLGLPNQSTVAKYALWIIAWKVKAPSNVTYGPVLPDVDLEKKAPSSRWFSFGSKLHAMALD